MVVSQSPKVEVAVDARELLVKGPGTAWDGEIPRRTLEGCDEREPRRQFVCVSNEERIGLEVGYHARPALRHGPDVLRRIERAHV